MAWQTLRLWLMAAGRQKKIICCMEGENVVTYGRLPSPAHCIDVTHPSILCLRGKIYFYFLNLRIFSAETIKEVEIINMFSKQTAMFFHIGNQIKGM